MSWRTVVISSNSKLDFQMNYLVVRSNEIQKVFLDEIAVLMIESTAVSMTAYLLNELMKRKIKVIFCNEKRQPAGELIPYCGSHDSSRKIYEQINFSEYVMDDVWREIIKEKILNQAKLLARLGLKDRQIQLETLAQEIEPGDPTNREGQAAKVYFNGLFGTDFSRREDTGRNAALNYGYAILLAAVDREISANGYLTQLGISHCSSVNAYNLGCDLMEPLRVLIDYLVVKNRIISFGSREKQILLSLLSQPVRVANRSEKLINGLGIYIRSVFEALQTADCSRIRFCEFDLELEMDD